MFKVFHSRESAAEGNQRAEMGPAARSMKRVRDDVSCPVPPSHRKTPEKAGVHLHHQT
jgi:hypothetical protein